MLRTIILLPACISAGIVTNTAVGGPEFGAPVRLKAAGEFIRTEAPGYAAPCWADVDRDGKSDLVVGQFAGGKLRVYRNLGNGELAAGAWLEVDGKVAEVPGVW